jgi:8-oxo-dGTP diphosphatase
VKVAVAVIYDELQRILITQRAAQNSSGGLWEFPGGKLEEKENPEAALIREVKEEVNLDVLSCDFLFQIDAKRVEGTLTLYVFLVQKFQGQAVRLENQADLRWVSPESLSDYQFPPTNAAILAWITQKFIRLEDCSDTQYDYLQRTS